MPLLVELCPVQAPPQLAREEASLGGSLTVSVGVATLGEDTATLEQLIRVADEELYHAKSAGKNRVAAAERR